MYISPILTAVSHMQVGVCSSDLPVRTLHPHNDVSVSQPQV